MLLVGKSVGTTSPFLLSAGRADEGRAEAREPQEKRGATPRLCLLPGLSVLISDPSLCVSQLAL